MIPTLRNNDQLLILNRFTHFFLRRDQIVVLEMPSSLIGAYEGQKKLFVKRLVGLEGDIIKVSGPQNYELLSCEAVFSAHCREIPKDHVFVIADNFGLDSHTWGPLPATRVKGIAIRKLGTRQQR